MRSYFLIGFFLCFITGSLFSQEPNHLKFKVNKGAPQFASENEQFKFGLGGRVYLDAAAYFDDKTDLGSGSEMRDARICFKAEVLKKWNAKINVGFAGGEVSLKDIYLQYNISTNSYVRGGNLLEPFGIEQTESSKTTKFMHVASTVEAFRPGRNLGVSYVNWGKKRYWEIGLFGSDINNTTEGDEGYGLTSRFAYALLNSNAIFHLGASGTYRTADSNGFADDGTENAKSIRYRSRAATHIERRRFIDAEIENAESQFKLGLEMIAAKGPISLQGEYMEASVNRKLLNGNFSAHGWYAQFGFLLKGGDYKYKIKSARLSKPNPKSLEFLIRYNKTDLNNSNIGIMGGKQQDVSLGFTWYVNYNVLMKFNFSNVDLDENALNEKENFNMIQTRLQFSF
ncbi:OprO/OprP family phosphate-selective porin [Marinifilum sp. RC60d5]|uniref:OprO/OprP family phosphate-selective porin n=1 Tax=Marinifilum sp. RC60d5 TaxID=3458414 RepID=UPI0040364317